MRPRSLALGLLAPLLLVAACAKTETPTSSGNPSVAPAPPPAPKPHVPLEAVSDRRDGSVIVLARVAGPSAQAPSPSGPPATTVAYIADEADSAVRAVDIATGALIARTPLPGRPTQMLVDKSGRLIVALRTEQALAILESTADPHDVLDETARIALAHPEPIALAISPDDANVVVTTGWGHSLEAYALADEVHARALDIDLAREPRALTLSDDGRTAYVAHASAGHVSAIAMNLGGGSSEAERVKKIDLGISGWTESGRAPSRLINPLLLFKIDDDLGLGSNDHFVCGTGMFDRRTITFPARFARQGFALAKVHVKTKARSTKGAAAEDVLEERIFAPHVAVATGDARVQSSGYGGGGFEEDANLPSELFDIDVIDGARGARVTGPFAAAGANVRSGADTCRLPRAAVADDAHERFFVSCIGNDKVIEYDASNKTPIAGFRRSIDVAAGPTGIAVEPGTDRVVVWSSFDRIVTVLTVPPAPRRDPKAKTSTLAAPTVAKIVIPPPESPLSAEALRGERLFHKSADPKISKDGRACASCHPDGRDDALVWSTPEGPRQTIMLAGRVERESPFGWLGKHGSLKEHITVTMKNLKGTGASDEELDAIVAWLRAMPSPPNAKVASQDLRIARGKELFNSSLLQCSSCHVEKTGFSDREAHDVASATPADASRQFLAPSLRFVGGSAPYFHDGRYASLGELLQKNDKMGDTKSLAPSDRDALEAYLRTL